MSEKTIEARITLRVDEDKVQNATRLLESYCAHMISDIVRSNGPVKIGSVTVDGN